ncbi:hypothetical protein [Desulfopila aestuarii]|uniref:Lipoprotein n=1 Tax=Desulfopila aestuarii DSM 18488 TaxID=1121416 RepID=A0A1M7YMK7_9BACT|nr:hypothetical protein [Desulfopila aestuarii]SHO53798.1 hypothetical protein SAMN02745220_05320 [Desulfopila aestuarii DSM 18488]
MKKSALLVFVLFSLLCGITACVQSKSIHELNPGVSFMGKEEVTKFLSGSKIEGPGAIVTYMEGGKADIFVKKNGKNINATWKVQDDGMVELITQGRKDRNYYSADGITAYGLDGGSSAIQKK